MKTTIAILFLMFTACIPQPPEPPEPIECDGGVDDDGGDMSPPADLVCPVSDTDRTVAQTLCNQFFDMFLTVCSCEGHNSPAFCSAAFFYCPPGQANCVRSCQDVVSIHDPTALLGACFSDLRDQINRPACAQLQTGEWVWRWHVACVGQLQTDPRCP